MPIPFIYYLFSVVMLATYFLLPYFLVTRSRARFRWAVRTWILVFMLEMIYVTFQSAAQMAALGFQQREGWLYPNAFLQELPLLAKLVMHGQANDWLLLLLLPVGPALLAFGVGYVLECQGRVNVWGSYWF